MTLVDGKKISPKEAKRLNDEVERESLIPGSKWFLITHGWWMRFMELKDNPGQSDHIQLPPINNESLVTQTESGYKVKPNLVEALNFVFVPERVFNILKEAYGVELTERDIIERYVIEGTLMEKKTFIELYPLQINIAHFKRRDVIVSMEVSQAESIDDICSKAMTALNIPKSGSSKIRFLIEENGKFEPISTTINQIIMNSILLSGSVIYIDDSGSSSSVLQEQGVSDINGSRRSNEFAASESLGLCGLQNLGNTCFMNSAIQCLSNVPELTEYFLKGDYEINFSNVLGTKGQLARAYGNLMQEMWSGTSSYVKPYKLKAVIGEFAPRFNGYAQQDSQELTSFLLDGLHEDLNRIMKKPYIEEKEDDTLSHEVKAAQAWSDYKKRNDSIIVDLMHGQLKSTVVCPICDKVSVKFDPFCFLSVPVPAKERQTSSIITLIRNDKWAKFAITHTNKATVGQATALIKSNLQLPESTKIVLLTMYAMEILNDDTVLTPSPYATSSTVKNYYAYIVDPGPLIIVENKSTAYERALGVPLVVNFPENGKELSRKLVLDKILPVVKERLFKTQNNQSVSDNADAENIAPTDKPKSNSQQQQQQQRFEFIFYCDKKYTNLPMEIEEAVAIPEDATDFKIVFRWQNSENFQHVDLSRFVERELNMTTPLKRCYTLNECVNLFTSREQLDQNDSWYCPRCKEHQRAFKKLDLWSLPKILIVHLKRFHYSRYSRDKIDTEIIIPTRGLDLSDKILNPSQKSYKYDLIAISNHMGGLGSGHYTALALNNNRWVDFNDSMVTVMKNSMPDTFSSREAYILYYRRRDDGVLSSSKPTTSGSQKLSANGNYLSGNLKLSPSDNGTSMDNNSTPSKRRASESTKMEVDNDDETEHFE